MKFNFLILLGIAAVCVFSASSPSQAGWGAIAYNRGTRQVSYSSGYNSMNEATWAALEACDGRCHIMSVENNSCCAFARSPSDHWGQATGYRSSGEATFAAIKACGIACELQITTCN